MPFFCGVAQSKLICQPEVSSEDLRLWVTCIVAGDRSRGRLLASGADAG